MHIHVSITNSRARMHEYNIPNDTVKNKLALIVKKKQQ